MKKYKLLQVTTFRKEVEVEANSLKEAIEKAANTTDLFYGGTDTLDFDTKFKAYPKGNTK